MWISFGSMHEVRAFRERKKRRLWIRGLVENCVVYGDRCYRGCDGVIVCGCREMRAKKAGGGRCYKSDKAFHCW